MIRVQEEDFDANQEIRALTEGNKGIGGVASFIGLVRESTNNQSISSLTLEHYPGMTEKILEQIEKDARERWSLNEVLVIHRVGRMEPGDQIVLVVTTSAHREAALESCQFLIDKLKTGAPFWKQEETPEGSHWVAERPDDINASERWDTDTKAECSPFNHGSGDLTKAS
jgi:molybdopterin synthase catalytic subunit